MCSLTSATSKLRRCAGGFILDHMRRSDGRLLHTFKDGQAKLDAYLDDYASLIDGLTRLYESTGEPRWIEAALELAAIMIDEFADRRAGGLLFHRAKARSPDRPAERHPR